jgi:hypothetical protein
MDVNYIESVVQKILNKSFSAQPRKKIIPYVDRLNICCPYCGDSHKNPYKKRGNLYLNKLIYVCFNCDKKTGFDKFLVDFNEQLDPDKKLELINFLSDRVSFSDYSDNIYDLKFDDLISLKDLEKFFNIGRNHQIHDFKPVDKSGGIYKYLLKRGITDDKQVNIYQAKFSKGDEKYEPIICFLNRKGDKVLGLQIRNLKEGKRRFFNIYNWETLYKWVNGDDVQVSLEKSVIFNKLSYFFNILNVDLEDRITVFEGYIDSIFYPNSIGAVGVNTDFTFLEKNLDIQYFFDNDSSGHIKSAEKIKAGFSVFLWKKLFLSIVENKKSKDPFDLWNKISSVKDLNKLSQIIENPYKNLKLYNFFNIDKYDLSYIPKVKIRRMNV